MCQTSKGRERDRERVIQCVTNKVAGWLSLCCVGSSLHFNDTYPQSNATTAFYWFTQQHIYYCIFNYFFPPLEREMRLMCMESAQTGRAHTIGPEMGPKRGLGGSTGIYIPFLWEKQWLKAKDVNPPPIRKKNNQKKQRKQKGKKIKRMRGTKWKDVNPMT